MLSKPGARPEQLSHPAEMQHIPPPILLLLFCLPSALNNILLGQSFPDAVDALFRDEPDFWNGISILRDAWLRDFQNLTSEMKMFNVSGMSALHIAAGIEAVELVSVLVSKCGKEALTWTSDDQITAVSYLLCLGVLQADHIV